MAEKKGLNLSRFQRNAPVAPIDDLLGLPPERMAQRAEELGLPSLLLAPNTVTPDPDQPRRLDHPDVLRRDAEHGDSVAAALLAELQSLGESLRDNGQLQPIVVYTDATGDARYRILIGQRRWSAATLLDLPTVWAIVIDPPSRIERIQRQYDENEQRAALSDMERAWTMARKKAAYAEADQPRSWIDVEREFHISTQRRQDLMRLLRFSDAGQALIDRHRWSEWTLRSLHTALQAGHMTHDDADAILRELAHSPDGVTTDVVRAAVAYHQPHAPDNARAMVTGAEAARDVHDTVMSNYEDVQPTAVLPDAAARGAGDTPTRQAQQHASRQATATAKVAQDGRVRTLRRMESQVLRWINDAQNSDLTAGERSELQARIQAVQDQLLVYQALLDEA